MTGAVRDINEPIVTATDDNSVETSSNEFEINAVDQGEICAVGSVTRPNFRTGECDLEVEPTGVVRRDEQEVIVFNAGD